MTLKFKIIKMKNLIFAVLLGTFIICGCSENPIEPVKIKENKTDNVIQGVHYPTISITTQNGVQTYKYLKVTYNIDFLEIELADCIGGGCGVSIEMNSIIYFETFN